MYQGQTGTDDGQDSLEEEGRCRRPSAEKRVMSPRGMHACGTCEHVGQAAGQPVATRRLGPLRGRCEGCDVGGDEHGGQLRGRQGIAGRTSG